MIYYSRSWHTRKSFPEYCHWRFPHLASRLNHWLTYKSPERNLEHNNSDDTFPIIGLAVSSLLLYPVLLFHNNAIFIPQVMPILSSLPQKHLPFHQPVISFQRCNNAHFLICQRILCGAFQIADIFIFMN